MNQKEKTTVKNLLKSKKAIVIYSMIGFTFLCITATCYFRNQSQDMALPEILYYSTQIISCFIVIGGLLVSVWQYYQSCQQKKSDLKLIQVQKAIDLSSYYKDHIISLSQPIAYVYKNSGRTFFWI